jgi:hypothetical protein
MKWLAGGNDWDDGLLELDDGTIVAKEYESDKHGVKRTWRLILSKNERSKMTDEERLAYIFSMR